MRPASSKVPCAARLDPQAPVHPHTGLAPCRLYFFDQDKAQTCVRLLQHRSSVARQVRHATTMLYAMGSLVMTRLVLGLFLLTD
jgi:hypothetical protein